MKITAQDFAKNPPNPGTMRGCLFYGPDEGMGRDFARKLLTRILGEGYDPLNLVELTGAQVKDDPARLYDELNSMSLMGGERLVWLREPETDAAALIKEAVVDGNAAAFLLVTDGDLAATSKIRQLFEKEKSLGAIACYRDDDRQLAQVVQERFRALGIQTDSDVVPYMLQHLGNDRGVTLQEIEKIDLFLGENRRLGFQQVIDLLGDNSELALDDLCHAVAGGQPAQLAGLLERLYAESTQPIGIFRILHNHFQRLYQLKALVGDQPGRIDQVLEQQRVFFKQKPRLKQQLLRWSPPALARAMDALLDAEKKVKTTGAPPELICNQLLQRLSLSVAR